MAKPGRTELNALRNLISETDLILETAPRLPQNRTGAARENLKAALALVDDFIAHPTQKPVPSLKPVIEALTRRGDLVLDPFCGSGSTLLASKILGRRYIGIELSKEYSDAAQRRV